MGFFLSCKEMGRGVTSLFLHAARRLLVNTLFLPNAPAKPCTVKGVWAELGRIV